MPLPRISLVAFEDRTNQFVFVSVPNERGRYLRTDRSVTLVECRLCKAAVGEPCKRHYGSDLVYHSTTHSERRSAAKRLGIPTTHADDIVGQRSD